MNNFCQFSYFLKRSNGEISLLYLKAFWGDGTK
jgi:hypothetical protein